VFFVEWWWCYIAIGWEYATAVVVVGVVVGRGVGRGGVDVDIYYVIIAVRR